MAAVLRGVEAPELAHFGEEEDALRAQLAEANRARGVAEDALLALKLAVGLLPGDELEVPEAGEAARLAAQARELAARLTSARDARLAYSRAALERTDQAFARALQECPDGVWREEGDLMRADLPDGVLATLRQPWRPLPGHHRPVADSGRPAPGPQEEGSGLAAGPPAAARQSKGKRKACAEEELVMCLVCLEECAAGETAAAEVPPPAAGPDGAGGSRGASVCSHRACRACLAQFCVHHVRERRLAMPCAGGGGCQGRYPPEQVAELLSEHPQELSLFRDLQAESTIVNKFYCTTPGCTAGPMEAPDPAHPLWPQVVCVVCDKVSCASCKAPWHAGATCEQFQALPAHLRSAEDAALLQLAGREGWRACPGCKAMIERNADGCNFVKCRCGTAFCYSCGERYEHERATAENVHGQPKCGCGLWAALRERDAFADEVLRQAAVAHARAHRRVRRRDPERRNGYFSMPPLRVRCNKARLLADCPHRRKCWYTHADEVDEAQ